jgi:hypothetical protein
MRVKLCARCPYTPRDLAGHYDAESVFHVCATCDGKQEVNARHYPREPTGGENAQQSPISSKRRNEALHNL